MISLIWNSKIESVFWVVKGMNRVNILKIVDIVLWT